MTQRLLKNGWQRKEDLINVARSEFSEKFHDLWSHQEIQSFFSAKLKHLKLVRA